MNDREAEPMPDRWWMEKEQLASLVSVLQADGYTVIAPTIQSDAIVYTEIKSVDQLPRGWHDVQSPGQYRLTKGERDTYFEYNVGPHSWKQFLFPPRVTVSTATRHQDQWCFESSADPVPRLAFLGVRACELAAIDVQDRVFLQGDYIDPDYQRRRESTLIIAVQCTVAASTCFCTSMDTGPRCDGGFDLALTETDHGFELQVGSDKGAEIAKRVTDRHADQSHLRAAEDARKCAVEQISKRMDRTNLPDLLMQNLDHPHWDDVASRCLGCTNCTMVCPTCFCATVSDVADLDGDHVDRVRQWDSCFNLNFTHTAGGTVRSDIRSRYRQWLTHKLATWQDQFDTSGCVGCGRCITWCPVGIDLTAEVAAIGQHPSSPRTVRLATQPRSVCNVPQGSSDQGGGG